MEGIGNNFIITFEMSQHITIKVNTLIPLKWNDNKNDKNMGVAQFMYVTLTFSMYLMKFQLP